MDIKKRKSLRRAGHDYSQPGAYFITICTCDNQNWFGSIKNDEIDYSPIGEMALQFWQEIPKHFPMVKLDSFAIMPNHIHGILVIESGRGMAKKEEMTSKKHQFQSIIPKSIGSVIRSYKAAVTRWCKENKGKTFRWQRNYYDQIIHTEEDLARIRKYIEENPSNWDRDPENPNKTNKDGKT